jgi:hypothetical protein
MNSMYPAMPGRPCGSLSFFVFGDRILNYQFLVAKLSILSLGCHLFKKSFCQRIIVIEKGYWLKLNKIRQDGQDLR